MKRRIVVGAIAALAIAVVLFLALRSRAGNGELEASGTVEATEADLGFQMAGRIVAVTVREGDPVTAGQVLARLDAAELDARKAAAESQLQAARAVLAEMEAGGRPEEVAQGRSAVRSAAQKLEDARRDLVRARNLYEGGAISREALDKANTAAELADASLDQAREQLQVLQTGPRKERVEAQRASVAAAEAQVRQVEALVDNAVIRAPFDGIVTIRHREAGEVVQPGLPVVTVMNPADRWVRIYIPEDRIGAVHLGQSARITSDTFQDRDYSGRVSFIADRAEFTPRNVQTKEERVKLVYAVHVQIAGDPGLELKPGVPADVALLDAAPRPDQSEG